METWTTRQARPHENFYHLRCAAPAFSRFSVFHVLCIYDYAVVEILLQTHSQAVQNFRSNKKKLVGKHRWFLKLHLNILYITHGATGTRVKNTSNKRLGFFVHHTRCKIGKSRDFH